MSDLGGREVADPGTVLLIKGLMRRDHHHLPPKPMRWKALAAPRLTTPKTTPT